MAKLKVTLELELDVPEGSEIVTLKDVGRFLKYDELLLSPELTWCQLDDASTEVGELTASDVSSDVLFELEGLYTACSSDIELIEE